MMMNLYVISIQIILKAKNLKSFCSQTILLVLRSLSELDKLDVSSIHRYIDITLTQTFSIANANSSKQFGVFCLSVF